MLHYPLWPPRKTHCILQLELTNPPGSLSGSNTSTNRFRIFYKILIPSTSNTMINIGCHSSFRWETKFGCTCRKNALHCLIRSFIQSVIDPTPSPRLWATIILSSTFRHYLACNQYSMWTSLDLIFHHYWKPWR